MKWMTNYFSTHYFVRPPSVTAEGFTQIPVKEGDKYLPFYYSKYNYLNRGAGSLVRTRHFEYALRLTKDYFYNCNVIDFGCADGPFLPSLARYFNSVVGIDKTSWALELASKVINAAGLTNVELICNSDLTIHDLKSKLGNRKYQVLFLLETLEHVGDKSNLWGSKVKFIRELFTLIDETGIIVISVPNMVGMPFLLQRFGLLLTNAYREPISISNLLKASFLNDTNDLEKGWQEENHLGFNHLKLEKYLENEFQIRQKKWLLFQVIYVCQRKPIHI